MPKKRIKSIGIILSGTGSDGSRGIRAIKAKGGLVIVQNPSNSRYDGMPNSVINTGNIDLILDAEEMGEELVGLLNYTDGKPIIQEKPEEFTTLYTNISDKIKEIKGVDFNHYKPSTIQRRIERRMAATKNTSLADYYDFLSKNVDEVESLFKDILIGVTSFFRDGESFDALEEHLEQYIKGKKDKNIRIWTPGCSTGEEAYSIAIVLSNILGSSINEYKIQIFATDLDEEALDFAIEAIYPESALIELDKKYKNQYFLAKFENYEIIKPIREMVIFSKHDIIKDSAFLKLDLVVCRNLLIYFSQELQKKLFPMFHYALNDDGLLFLGKSESVGPSQDYFRITDKKWRIFTANYLGKKELPQTVKFFEKTDLVNNSKDIEDIKTTTFLDSVNTYINKYIVPKCIVIDENMDIVYVKGNNPYLLRPEGKQTQNVFKNVVPILSIELKEAIDRSIKENSIIKSKFQKVILLDEVIRYVRITVMPMEKDSKNILSLVCFQEENIENFKNLEVCDIDDNKRVEELEFELLTTKERLQIVIEELETSNEELRSSNEKLQLTNEELETTNEELQTAYTELRTIDDEKEKHLTELAKITSDYEVSSNRLSAAVNGINMGIYDYYIPIRKDDYWSETWAELLGYKISELPSDKSLMVDWIDERIHLEELDDVRNMKESYFNGEINQFRAHMRVRHKKGHWVWIEDYAISIKRDHKNRVIHTVGTTRDITQEVKDHEELIKLTRRLQITQKIASLGSWEWDIANGTIWWSNETYSIFGLDERVNITYGLLLSKIHKDDRADVELNIQKALNRRFRYNIKHRIIHPTKGSVYVREIAKAEYDTDGKPTKVIGTIQDITEEINSKKALEESEKRLEITTNVSNIALWEFDLSTNAFYWNEKSYEMFGIDKNTKITYEFWISLVHPDDFEKVSKKIDRAIKEKRIYSLVFRTICPNGKTYTIQSTGTPIYDNNKLEKIIGTNIDLTKSLEEGIIKL